MSQRLLTGPRRRRVLVAQAVFLGAHHRQYRLVLADAVGNTVTMTGLSATKASGSG